jgi:hypothetical protein
LVLGCDLSSLWTLEKHHAKSGRSNIEFLNKHFYFIYVALLSMEVGYNAKDRKYRVMVLYRGLLGKGKSM